MDNPSAIKFKWTKDDDALLRAMASKHTAAQIAQVLGISRNAVIGRCYREHIKLLGSSSNRMAPKPAKPIRLTTVTVPTPAPLPIAKPVSVAPVVPTGPGVSFFDLAPRMCRFPLGGPKEPARAFCGERTPEGSSWCAAHRAIVYQPRPPRKTEARPFAFNRPVNARILDAAE